MISNVALNVQVSSLQSSERSFVFTFELVNFIFSHRNLMQQQLLFPRSLRLWPCPHRAKRSAASAGYLFLFSFFFQHPLVKHVAQAAIQSRCTKAECTRCFETGLKAVHNILPNVAQPSTSVVILSHSKTCDFIWSITLEPKKGKKGVAVDESDVTSVPGSVCTRLWLTLSQMRNLGTVKASL